MRFSYDGVQDCKKFGVNDAMAPTDKIVLVSFDGDWDIWIAESQMGIGEVKRYYRVNYDRNVDILVLNQSQAPMFVVNSESFADDDTDTDTFSTGPFYDIGVAEAYLNKLRLEESFIGGEVEPLLKPD
jgi:hypothetical protein